MTFVRIPRFFATFGLAVTVSATSVASVCARQTMDNLESWRAHLESQAGENSMWWTSNSTYLDEDGGIEAYGMRFEILPGGVAARGCLWGSRNGETLGPFWEFFMAWDPEAEKGMLYQVSPAGAFGMGRSWIEADGLEVAEQTFRGADGMAFRVRHETRNVDANTREGGSFDWADGDWMARRTYRWVRRPGDGAPC